MNLSADYDKLLEQTKLEEIEWFKEEFDQLFNNKNGKYTDGDKYLANQILDNFTSNIHILNNKE